MFPQTFILDNEAKRRRLIDLIAAIPLKHPYHVLIERYERHRTLQANRRYWLLCERVAQHTGHDKDEIHDFFKEKFLGTRLIEIAGERFWARPSTRKMKVGAFNDYMRQCEQYAIETIGVWLE